MSEANAIGAFCGVTDSHLSPEGRRQVERLFYALQHVKIDRVVSSPLARAQETAKAAVGKRGIPIETLNDLSEVDFGEWENMTFDEIEKADKELFKRFISEDMGFSFPGGESLRGFAARTKKVANVLLKSESSNVVVFSHGGVIRHLLCHYLELPYDKKYIFDIQPGSVATLDFYDGATVLSRLELL